MVTPLFERNSRYALKQNGINIGNPALVVQRAYWNPTGEDNDGEWHRNIDFYIERTRQKAQAFTFENAKHVTDECVFSDDRGRSVPVVDMSGDPNEYNIALFSSQIAINLSDVKISIIFEKFDEFWSAKTIVDFSYFTKTAISPEYLSSLNSDLAAIEETLVSRYNKRGERVGDVKGGRRVWKDERSRVQAEISRISHSISRTAAQITQDLFPPKGVGIPGVPCDADDDLFASFMGFSLGINLPPSEAGAATRLNRGKSSDVISNINVSGIFDHNNDNQVLEIIDAVWPIATDLNPYIYYGDGELGDPFEIAKMTREFTISRLNGSRALYISSLGAMREIAEREVYFPLAYLLISPHRASWQIGRMINRMHSLGLFRLASFFEYDKIEEANDKMRQLIDALDKGEDAEIISDQFSAISAKIENGLNYRVEWSKYYYQLFRDSLDMINFDKVEGYETYREFVIRKMGARFGTIDSVSRRFKHLSRLIQARRDRKIGSSINELLAFAETVSVVPVAYYSYSVLEHLDKMGFIEYLNGKLTNLVGAVIQQPAMLVLWVIFITLYGGFVLIYRRWKFWGRLAKFHL